MFIMLKCTKRPQQTHGGVRKIRAAHENVHFRLRLALIARSNPRLVLSIPWT